MLTTFNRKAAATMTSREIADLVESRHGSVKRCIKRLMQSGAIASTPAVEFKTADNVTSQESLIGKRDSYVIVAQVSPASTARLVDRWEKLETATTPVQAGGHFARFHQSGRRSARMDRSGRRKRGVASGAGSGSAGGGFCGQLP